DRQASRERAGRDRIPDFGIERRNSPDHQADGSAFVVRTKIVSDGRMPDEQGSAAAAECMAANGDAVMDVEFLFLHIYDDFASSAQVGSAALSCAALVLNFHYSITPQSIPASAGMNWLNRSLICVMDSPRSS